MAIALKGTGSATTANSTTANQATLVVTTATTAGAAGDLAVLLYAVDNNQTTDGDENAVTAVTDSGGNKWVKAVEFTNGQAAVQGGATCGIWYSNLRFALPIAGTVTLTFSNATSRDATAASLTYYTVPNGYDAIVEGTATLANDAAAAGSLSVTTSNRSCLRIRAIATESNSLTAITPTNTFAAVTQAVANSGTAATSMGVRGEWIINTGTGTASVPTGGVSAVDHASVYVAFKEILVASPWNNSSEVGAQVAIAGRKSVIASLIVAASAGLYMPPIPPPVAAMPEGWQQPLSVAPPVNRVTAPSYDLPLAPVVADIVTPPSATGVPLHFGSGTPRLRQVYYQARFEPPSFAASVQVAPIPIPLDLGGQLPQTRAVYYQARSEPPYVAPVVTVTATVGWLAPLSIGLPVNRAADTNRPFPWFTPNPVTLDEWQQPLSVAPKAAKAQTDFGFVPFDKAQVSVNFTAFGWQQPLSVAPSTAKAKAEFGSVPYTTQVTVAVTPPYWQQALSGVPAVNRVATADYALPIYIAPVVNNTVTIDKWQQPLSVPAKTATAQPGFGFVPFNTAQTVVAPPATATGVPLYSGGAPPRLRRVYYQARFEPPYTVPIVVTPRTGIPLDLGGQLPQLRSVYYQARSEPLYVASAATITVNVTGVAGTGVAGGITPSVPATVSGVSGTGVGRAIIPNVGATVSGASGTGTAGSISGSISPFVFVSQASGTGSAGTVRAAIDKTLSQASGIGIAGSISDIDAGGITGTTGTGTAGGIFAQVSAFLSGATGTGVARTGIGAVDKGTTGVAATGSAGGIFASISAFLSGATGTGLAGTIAAIASSPGSVTLIGIAGTGQAGLIQAAIDKPFSGAQGTGVAGSGIVPSVAAGVTQASGTGLAGTIVASTSSPGSGNVVGVAGTGTAGAITASVAAFISGGSGVGVARSISGADAIGFVGVAGTGVGRTITPSVAANITGAAGIGSAGIITVAFSGGTVTANLIGVSGTGVAGTIVGFSSTVPVTVPGGGGGFVKPTKPTTFVPVKRKGGFTEPKLQDRVEVRRPLKPDQPEQPVEVVVELPPALVERLKDVLDPPRIEFESDEDAVARALELYLEQENELRGAIASAATDIIASMINEIIEDLETETDGDV